MKGQVRLSQCMIVKNEEKNIRKALSWAKDIAFEQIVVDTGSTDRTVEIAEEMGAKVFHFTWIDDFSAAKNFAIEKASGNWIAFLDADEYFLEKDAKKLLHYLKQIKQQMNAKNKPHIVRCQLIHLDDNNIPFSADIQDRIFRNISALRYHNKIHEALSLPKGYELKHVTCQGDVAIMHTGYSESAFESTKKSERNIRLLRLEIEENPENYNAYSYLGDSLLASRQNEEAMDCYRKVLEQDPPLKYLTQDCYNQACRKLLDMLVTFGEMENEEEIFFIAKRMGYPDNDNPDINYFLGYWMMQKKEYVQVKEELETAIVKIENYRGSDTIDSAGHLEEIYRWLANACLKLEQPADTVRYTVLSLRVNPWQEELLKLLLAMLMPEPGESEHAEGTWKLLAGLYHLEQERDRLFILKCAMIVGFKALEEKIK